MNNLSICGEVCNCVKCRATNIPKPVKFHELADGAHSALARWCEGVWSNQWEDGLDVDPPKVKRDRKDMEIVNVIITPLYRAVFED